MAEQITYVKIPKVDSNGNDLTTTLKSLSQITIPYTNGSSSICPVIGITDSGNYFTYVVGDSKGEVEESDASTLKYELTGSIDTGFINASQFAPEFRTLNASVPSSSLLPYFYNSTNSSIQVNTDPQKDLVLFTNNFYISASTGGQSGFSIEVELYKADSSRNTRTRLTTSPAVTSGGWRGPYDRTVTIPSESISPGDIFYLGCQPITLASGVQNVSIKNSTDAGKFNPSQIFLSSTAASGNPIETVPETYVTTLFNGSNCDVMLNNVSQYPLNPFLQDLDYSTNPITPINIERIISGTAEKGTVPESYYTSLSQITPRYLGTKNQSSGVNQYIEDAGNTDFGTPINIGTYGKVAPITQNETNIFEYEWGSSTYPMIQGYGQMKLSNILQATSPDLVRVVQKTSNAIKKPYPDGRVLTTSQPSIRDYRQSTNPLDPSPITGSTNTGKYYWIISQSRGEFYTTLNSSNPRNSTIQLGNYSQNTISEPIMPNTSKVVSTGWGTPEKPNYMLTSSFTGGVTTGDGQGLLVSQRISGSYGYIDSSQNYLLIMGWNEDLSETALNGVGSVSIEKPTKLTYDKVLNEINSGMTKGSRWYLSLYRELENPTDSQSLEEALNSGNYLEPYNEGYNTLNSTGNYDFPLEARGVYEITGTNASFSNSYDTSVVFLILKNGVNFPLSGSSGLPYQQLNIGESSSTQRRQHPGSPVNNLGAFIWQATGKEQITGEEYIVIQDELKGVGPGFFMDQAVPDYITNNIETITKKYGSNKT